MLPLVAIGDSLTMGFCSGSIYKTGISFPSMIARSLRTQVPFSAPEFDKAEPSNGGFPFNLEWLLHRLSKDFPNGISTKNFLKVTSEINKQLDVVESWWEQMSHTIPSENICHHNLAILSYTVQDSYQLTTEILRKKIKKSKNNFLLFTQIPEFPMYRAASITLSEQGPEITQLQRLEQLCVQYTGVENLILNLGSNNVLGAIIDMEIKYSKDHEMFCNPHERACNVWLPHHFEMTFRHLASKIKKMSVKNILVSTVPYVTIPPVSRGTPSKKPTDRYFDYYTRPWIWDSSFEPRYHPFLSRQQVTTLDEIVDHYNYAIRKIANEFGWHIIDFCAMLDKIAFRRNGGSVDFVWPQNAVAALKKNSSTSYLVRSDNTIALDTRYIELCKNQNGNCVIEKGGLFSLDGVHPTTTMYGLIAEDFLRVMNEIGVKNSDGEKLALDWDFIVQNDTLLNNPPPLLSDLRSVIGAMSGKLYGKIFFKVLESFKSSMN